MGKHLLLKSKVLEVVHDDDIFGPLRKVSEPLMERQVHIDVEFPRGGRGMNTYVLQQPSKMSVLGCMNHQVLVKRSNVDERNDVSRNDVSSAQHIVEHASPSRIVYRHIVLCLLVFLTVERGSPVIASIEEMLVY